MSEQIKLSMLLKANEQIEPQLEEVTRAINQLGMKVSAVGRASLSVRIPKIEFEKLFTSKIVEQGEVKPAGQDFGSRAGVVAIETIPIPEELEKYISIISIEPPPRRF